LEWGVEQLKADGRKMNVAVGIGLIFCYSTCTALRCAFINVQNATLVSTVWTARRAATVTNAMLVRVRVIQSQDDVIVRLERPDASVTRVSKKVQLNL